MAPLLTAVLNEDALLSVAHALLRTRLFGPYGVVMLSRCNRFLHALLRQLSVEAEAAERSGWHAEYTWVIPDFSKLTTADPKPRVLSPSFSSAHGHQWRLLLFPAGNGVPHISLYLDVANAATLPDEWSRQASFSLRLHRQEGDGEDIVKDTDHCFTTRAADWGFREVLSLERLTSEQGWLVNDALKISVTVEASPPSLQTFNRLCGLLRLRERERQAFQDAIPNWLREVNEYIARADELPPAAVLRCERCKHPLPAIKERTPGLEPFFSCDQDGCTGWLRLSQVHTQLLRLTVPEEAERQHAEQRRPRSLGAEEDLIQPEDLANPCFARSLHPLFARSGLRFDRRMSGT